VWRGRPARVPLVVVHVRILLFAEGFWPAAASLLRYHFNMPDVEWIRDLCGSLDEVSENLQWGETLCFKLRGKLFAMVDLSQGKLAPVILKSAPEKFPELVETEGIYPAPYVGRYKWIQLANSNVLPAADLEALIRESYDLVAKKVHKRNANKKNAPKKNAAKKKAAPKRTPRKRSTK
jgi:predicted DNA-binding protein (MmcQ/YjbR family)